MVEKKSFLICGHSNPDEDCIASMIAFAIILTKFDKMVQIYINGNVSDNIKYLLNICKYNSIELINNKNNINNDIDTLIICDTPKLSMLDINKKIKNLYNKKDILKIEIDHHIGTDGEYIGNYDYSLVTEASSTSELVGILALKLKKRTNLLKRFQISDPFSRNLVLSIITGIVGDTNMGQFLKSRRERRFYNIFSDMYNTILMTTTTKETNFSDISQVFQELKKLSSQDEKCYNYIMKNQNYSKSIGYIILKDKDTQFIYNEFERDLIISIARHVANELAEKSGKLSLMIYYDNPQESNLIQFRMRRSHNYKKFDLRNVLDIFSISNGGGHEGAIGFRFNREEIDDIDKFVNKILTRIGKEINEIE